MIIDTHVHLEDTAAVADVETFVDSAQVDKLFLFSRDPAGRGGEVRTYLEELARLAEKTDLVFPFAWVDPLDENAAETARWAIEELGFRGIKLIPRGWYPQDKRAGAVYEVAAECNVPIMFHSGILWQAGDCSRFCRPVNFECLWDYPQARFSLAHISWPWTDECIATVQKMNFMRPELDQAYIDITPGTPPCYRPEALTRCLTIVGADKMFYGSDSGIPKGSVPQGSWRDDEKLLTEIGADKGQIAAVLGKTALSFIGEL